MAFLVFFCLGVLTVLASFCTLRRKAVYTELTIYEATEGMLPVDRELLLGIEKESGPVPAFHKNSPNYRREVRLNMERLRDQFQRVLNNAAKSRHWAHADWRIIVKHRLEHPPEALEATNRVLNAERDLRRLIHRGLFRIWLWSLIGFHHRYWGPVPNLRKLDILKVLEGYDRVRLAAVNLARCYGEAGISEEIAGTM